VPVVVLAVPPLTVVLVVQEKVTLYVPEAIGAGGVKGVQGAGEHVVLVVAVHVLVTPPLLDIVSVGLDSAVPSPVSIFCSALSVIV
jgi:hypothetical protein